MKIKPIYFIILIIFSSFLAISKDLEFLVKLRPNLYQINEENIKQNKNFKFLLNLYPTLKISQLHPDQNKILAEPRLDLWYKISISTNESEKNIVSNLSKSSILQQVEFIKDLNISLQFIPNDTLINPSKIDTTAMTNSPWMYNNINAFKAWDVTRGDSNVAIGISDSEFDLNHYDLKNKIKHNYNDPINGIDDDKNGYIDDFSGWDFGENDNNTQYVTECNHHGTQMAGAAVAEPNNIRGTAGTGYNCTFIPAKHTYLSGGCKYTSFYSSLKYLADVGAKVINMSWGGDDSTANSNIYLKDLIYYVSVVKDVSLLSASGNQFREQDLYPASFENVLSVGSSDIKNCLTQDPILFGGQYSGTSYSKFVDVLAPGNGVLLLTTNNRTVYENYTSSAATALTSGATALVRSKFPQFTGLQAIEQIRVTAKNIDTVSNGCGTLVIRNNRFKQKYGKGLLDMFKAVSDTSSPAVRMVKHQFSPWYAPNNSIVNLKLDFVNYLAKTKSLKIKITASKPNFFKVIDSIQTLGSINMLQKVSLSNIKVQIFNNCPAFKYDTLKIEFFDTLANGQIYTDYQYKIIQLNYAINSFEYLDTNNISIPIFSNGTSMGNRNFGLFIGDAFRYKNSYLSSDCGLIIAKSPTQVSANIVNGSGNYDQDFTSVTDISKKKVNFADQYFEGKFTDMVSNPNAVNVEVVQKAFASNQPGMENFVIQEYNITNKDIVVIDSMGVGLYSDIDIFDNSQNKVVWDCRNKIGYAFETTSKNIYAGIQLLTNQKAGFFPIDYNTSQNPLGINLNNGLNDTERFRLVTSGVIKNSAGGSTGSDIAMTVSAIVKNLAPNQSEKVAFAYVAGKDSLDLLKNAKAAMERYSFLNSQAVILVKDTIYTCTDSVKNEIIKPLNGKKFKFYQSNNYCLNPVTIDSIWNMPSIKTPDSVFVQNSDSIVDSRLKKITLLSYPWNKMEIKSDIGDTVNINQVINFSTNQVPANFKLKWIFGTNNFSDTSNARTPQFAYSQSGVFNVKLILNSKENCIDTIDKNIKVRLTTGLNYNFDQSFKIYPNPAINTLTLFSSQIQEQLFIKITDLSGRIIMTKIMNLTQNQEVELDISQIVTGVYQISLQNNNITFNKRLLITK